MTLYKEYNEVDGKTIKITISFNKNTHSWATSQNIPIGYRATVVPVERSADGMIESFTAFSGFNATLLPVERQSKKRLQEAINILNDKRESFLNHFRNEVNEGY